MQQDLEPGKVVGSAVAGPHVVGIDGNYDDVNRLCTQVGDRYGWAFANINLRSYYAEGAKTYGFEDRQPLVVIHGDHRIGAGQLIWRKRRVGGEWPDYIHPLLAQCCEHGLDSVGLLVTEMSRFAGMRIEPAH